jgi:hypothetical protein
MATNNREKLPFLSPLVHFPWTSKENEQYIYSEVTIND